MQQVQRKMQRKGTHFWILPLGKNSSETDIRRLVIDLKLFGFKAGLAKRKVRPGDRICFYFPGKGIIAQATSKTEPKLEPRKISSDYPWVIELDEVEVCSPPIEIDMKMRQRLDAFRHREKGVQWAWFVQGGHKITECDYLVLTHSASIYNK
jgi:hypothetical protein